MAVITPVTNQVKSGVDTVLWETLTENDTADAVILNGTGPLAVSMQVTGTFGGATVVLEGSNDGVNYSTLADVQGLSTGLNTAGIVEYSTSVVYLRAAAASGTAQDVDVTLSVRG